MCFRMKQINPEKMEAETSSAMVYLNGCEVIANLTWDKTFYYVWFEIADHMLDAVDEFPSLQNVVDEAEEDLAKISVCAAYDLDSINALCKKYCGDNEPALFYKDDWGNICGA